MSARAANRRLRLLLLFFCLVFAGTIARAVWLQGVQARSLATMATEQNRRVESIPARRGTIYDRTGTQLAIGQQATTVYANPKEVREPRRVAVTAGRVLGVDPNVVLRALADRSRGFVYIKRKANPAAAALLERRELAGIGFYPEERRTYPQRSVAAQVLGYAGIDNRGLAGLEYSLERLLAGRPGSETLVTDPIGRAIERVSSVNERAGRDVFLTLDHTLQANTELVLRQTVARWKARAATAIVLDPRSGAVLAMATAPGFDANRFPDVPRRFHRNRAVEDTYEPGSTFKVVTVAGVLAEGVATPRTSFTLPYEIQVADRRIRDAEERGTEQMSVARILSHSSNVGAITLAQLLGPERLSAWIERFGFGKKTGIDYPDETRGIVLPTEEWSGSTIGNVPIGHGIAVTPVQMASAYAALANGGVLVSPHLIQRIQGKRPVRPVRRRIVPAPVARQVLAMLKDVVADGTGTLAAVPGYSVAGKTGTAAKPDPRGGYSDSLYVASFVGFAPASDPRLVVLVTVDEPHGAIWGGVVAAPAFKEIMRSSLQYLEIPPRLPAG